MSLTNYGENLFLSTFTGSGAKYLALYTATPTETGGGTEVTGGAYARRQISFTAPAGGETKNATLIQFPTATANWGVVTSFGVCDALTGGNVIWYGTLTDSNGNPAPKTVTPGDIFQVPVGDLILGLE